MSSQLRSFGPRLRGMVDPSTQSIALASERPLYTLHQAHVVASLLARGGIDAKVELARLGLSIIPKLVAPLSRVEQLLDRAAELLGDPLFGATLMDELAPGAFGLLEFQARSAPTLREALEGICEFAALVNPLVSYRVLTAEREATIHCVSKARGDVLGRQLNLYELRRLWWSLRSWPIEPARATRVWLPLRGLAADHVAKHFECDAITRSGSFGLAMPLSDLDRPLRAADRPLHAFLTDQLRTQAAAAARDDDVIGCSMIEIGQRLDKGTPTADAIAHALGMSARTLTRRFMEAGTSFRSIVDHVRRQRFEELAVQGIRGRPAAKALGFADARSMRRATARWRRSDSTGC
jgi:AraC-like DNA-binding protein